MGYYSLGRVDQLGVHDGVRVAVLTDHRAADEIDRAWELSVVFALSRIVGPLARDVADEVWVLFPEPPPRRMVELCAAAGAHVHVDRARIAQAAQNPDRADAIAREALERLGPAVLAAFEVRSRAELPELERRIREAPGTDDPDERELVRAYAILQLGSALGALLRREVGGEWERAPQASGAVPFVVGTPRGQVRVFDAAERFLRPGAAGSLASLFEVASGPHAGEVRFALRRRDWAGRSTSLVVPGLPLPEPPDLPPDIDLPIVALARELPDATWSIGSDEAPRLPSLLDEARDGLGRAEVQVVGVGRDLWVVRGARASENLLDPAFLSSLQQRIGAPTLAVGVPALGELWVTRGPTGPADVPRFSMLLAERRDRAPRAGRLTAQVLLAQDGQLVGFGRLERVGPPS